MTFATKIALFAIIAYCSCAPHQPPLIDTSYNATIDCLKELNVTDLSPGTNPDEAVTIRNCHSECVYKTLGILQDDSFSVEGTKKYVNNVGFYTLDKNTAAQKAIELCSKTVSKVEGEECSLGRLVRECLFDNKKKVVPSNK